MKFVLYFAYGSNLDVDQMRERLDKPTLHPAGVAELGGWSFAFNKHSTDGSDKANIVTDASGRVLGCLYDLTPADLAILARHEAGYTIRDVEVIREGSPVTAKVFVAKQVCDKECGPSKSYRDQIVRGARAIGIDGTYIELLRSLKGNQTIGEERAAGGSA